MYRKVLKFGFVSSIIIFAACEDSLSTKDISAIDPAYKIKAARPHEEYGDNPVAADEKYKGKVLEVTGIISKIDAVLGSYFVHLQVTPHRSLSDLRCVFPGKCESQIVRLKKDQIVSIKGEYDGLYLGTMVVLRNCVVKREEE